MRSILFFTSTALAVCVGSVAFAEGTIPVEMKDGKFNPSTITIPANQKVELTVTNHERAGVEFESYELNREVKIKPGESTTIFVGPLKAGTYPIFDDNNPDAKGAVVAQ